MSTSFRHGFIASKALGYFLEVVRQGSITGASAALHVAQPALTRQMQLLEEDLGAALLVRHGRGVELTEAGALLRERAEMLLALNLQCRDEVRHRNAEPRGRIRFGFLPSLSNLLIGKAVAESLQRYPLLAFSLHEGFSQELRSLLLGGQIDLAIMSIEMQHQDLHATPLFAEDLWLASRPDRWKFSSRRSVRGRDLQGLPLMHASFLRARLDKLAGHEGLKLQHVLEGEAMAAIRAAARAGVGYIVGPRSGLELDIRAGEFVGAPIAGLDVVRALFRRADRPASRALSEFVALLLRHVAALADEGLVRTAAPAARRRAATGRRVQGAA